MTSVSIIMTPWNRTALLANTLDSIYAQNYPNLQIIVVEDDPAEASTEMLCLRHGIDYSKRMRRGTSEQWTNPAPLLNHGIKKATGDILIFQNAECKHESPNVIEAIVAPIDADPTVSTVPLVQSLTPNGEFEKWLMHPTDIERAGWISYFCQAVRRDAVMKVGGFDEVFTKYGQEDDLFEFRLRKSGIHFQYVTDVLVSHQWHPRYTYTGIEQPGEVIRLQIEAAVNAGEQPNVANFGREWGNI